MSLVIGLIYQDQIGLAIEGLRAPCYAPERVGDEALENMTEKRPDEITLYPKKSGQWGLLVTSALFTACGIWMIFEGEWMGYVCAAFFGLCTFVFVVQLRPGASYLTIRKDGFEYAAMFKSHRVLWRDIESFGIMTQRQTGITVNKMVGWNYLRAPELKSRGRTISRAITGIEAGLPDTYGLKAEKLMDLMMEFWELDHMAARAETGEHEYSQRGRELNG